jgi:hypothetical protein
MSKRTTPVVFKDACCQYTQRVRQFLSFAITTSFRYCKLYWCCSFVYCVPCYTLKDYIRFCIETFFFFFLSVGPAIPRLMYCSLPRLIVLIPLWFRPFISRGALFLLYPSLVILYQTSYWCAYLMTGWWNTSFSPLKIGQIYNRNLSTCVLESLSLSDWILYRTLQKKWPHFVCPEPLFIQLLKESCNRNNNCT